MLKLIDQVWKNAGHNAGLISAVYLILAIAVTATAAMLGLADLLWNGQVAGTNVIGFEPLSTKQVGYLYAPNWALASIVLLPLALLNLLNARDGIEPLINTLIEQRMLIRIDNSPIDAPALMEMWRRESIRWSFICFLLFIFTAIFTLYGDFYSVVWQWNLHPEVQLKEFTVENPLRISHSKYEFDWSVGSTLSGIDVGKWTNAIFALIAYLLVPIFGAGFLLSGFVWFLSFCTFFSRSSLRRKGLVLVPDTASSDCRAGFENFEEIFDHLVQAAIYTALLALVMHLQNVFLRSPFHSTIVDMVFGGAIETLPSLQKFDFSPLMSFLTTVDSVIGVPIDGANFQIFISALAMILLVVIVVGSIWASLRRSAIDGRRYLTQNHNLSKEQKECLGKMAVWPVGWISLNWLVGVVFVVFMSMYIVNLVSLIVLVGLIWVVGSPLMGVVKSLTNRGN